MIFLLKDKAILENLSHGNIYEGKIKTLYRSYGIKENFCSFYMQDKSLLISRLDRDYVIKILSDDYNVEELAAFLKTGSAGGLFLPPQLLKSLEPFLALGTPRLCELRYCGIMEFKGEHVHVNISDNPDLTEVYKVLKADFNIEYSSWLVDVSHRVRHGISKVYLYKNASTVTALYDADNRVFLTQVATDAKKRGQGLAGEMLKEVSGRYKNEGKTVSLVCRNPLIPFYEKLGFEKTGEAAIAFLEA